jgi:glycine cleavage system H protein
MKDFSQIILPEGLYYTREHVWVGKDIEGWRAGITDFAQDQLGEVVYVDLPAESESFATGDEFGTVESIKNVSSLFMPVEGIVMAVNPELDSVPSLVNVDCYGKAWMIRLDPDREEDVKCLLSAAEYRKYIGS